MRDKILTYLGFARKSGNLMIGQGTCVSAMERGKIRLLLMCEDLSDNTKSKLIRSCENCGVEYRIYGQSDELGKAAGTAGCAVFGVPDDNFSEVIIRTIDSIQDKEA